MNMNKKIHFYNRDYPNATKLFFTLHKLHKTCKIWGFEKILCLFETVNFDIKGQFCDNPILQIELLVYSNNTEHYKTQKKHYAIIRNTEALEDMCSEIYKDIMNHEPHMTLLEKFVYYGHNTIYIPHIEQERVTTLIEVPRC